MYQRGKNMKSKSKTIVLLLAVLLMILGLAACGNKGKTKGQGTQDGKGGEAAETLTKLMAEETAILSENKDLWEKVFMAADKGSAMIEDGSNYGDFLLSTIEGAKDQFTEEEQKILTEGAEKIRDIEAKVIELKKQHPELAQQNPSGDGSMSVPAGDGGKTQNFPAFEGKDLDGQAVKSQDLFSSNKVTVVNFWFTTCKPCVGELSELDSLNKELAAKGGSVIGVNSFTLDGDEQAIKEAKDVLDQKGVSYRNVYFDSKSEAGKFAGEVYAYPTTYVVDKTGRIVGDPIVGSISDKKQMDLLRQRIDEALKAA